MSTPELERAIAAARWHGVESDLKEVITRMLDVSPDVVTRVIYAWEALSSKRLVSQDDRLTNEIEELSCGDNIPSEARRAIEHTATRAFKRLAIRFRMERGAPLQIPFAHLVPAENPSRICDGCAWQFECVRDDLSTPQKCRAGTYVVTKEQPAPAYGRGFTRGFLHEYASVIPVKLTDATVTVTAVHPRGTYVVNIMDVRI